MSEGGQHPQSGSREGAAGLWKVWQEGEAEHGVESPLGQWRAAQGPAMKGHACHAEKIGLCQTADGKSVGGASGTQDGLCTQ